MIKNLKLGTDFELFLQNQDTKEVVSAEGLVKGTKQEPFCFDESDKQYAISLDNVSVEGNIPPAQDAYTFYKNVQKTIDYINSIVPKELKAMPIPAARLDKKYIETENAQLLGCEHDINCYTGDVNPKPNVKDENYTLRSCGGHIHFSYDKPDPIMSMDIVRAFDLFIGVPSVLLEPDNERKKLYGKAGAMRLKQYGGEYRSPSNFYLSSKEMTEWIFNTAQEGVNFINANGVEPLFEDESLIISAINDKNEELAKQLINKYNLKLV